MKIAASATLNSRWNSAVHLGGVRLERAQFPRDHGQEGQRDQDADESVEQVADRQPPARRIAADAGFD